MRRFALLLLLASATAAGESLVDSPRWSSEYDPLFEKYTKRYFGPFFDWRWFKAQAIAESDLDPQARSDKGAVGLMQILPSTYAEIQGDNPHFIDITTPRWNIAAGIYYDRLLYRKWQLPSEQERLYLAFASYNAGYLRMRRVVRRSGEEGRSWEELKSHLPGETRLYVNKIRYLMKRGGPGRPRLRGVARLFSRSDDSPRE